MPTLEAPNAAAAAAYKRQFHGKAHNKPTLGSYKSAHLLISEN